MPRPLHDRHNPEPLGPPPDRLTADAKACWAEIAAELARAHVGNRLDRFAVELLADALAEYRRLAASGEPKHAPFAVSSWKRCVKLLSEFGLTPAGRTRVRTVAPAAPLDAFDRFLSQSPPR
jgi:P27 family predicted phage terminase small subunit